MIFDKTLFSMFRYMYVHICKAFMKSYKLSEVHILCWHVHTNTSEGIWRYAQLFTNIVYLCLKRYTCMWHAIHIWWWVLSISPVTLKWQSIYFKAISICSKCLIKKVIRDYFISNFALKLICHSMPIFSGYWSGFFKYW